MKHLLPTRLITPLAGIVLCLSMVVLASGQYPPPPRQGAHVAGPSGDHLPEWMNRHSNLTPEQQQQALGREPGFRELSPQKQQELRNRLAQLNAMTPEKRQRLLERNEWMEHLTPAQRGQVDNAMRQLDSLPPDQHLYVARTFRGLRELSPAQRQTVLRSDRFNHLTEAERAALYSLMSVEPLLPPPYDPGPPPFR